MSDYSPFDAKGTDLKPGIRWMVFAIAIGATLLFDGVVPACAWGLWTFCMIVGPQDTAGSPW